MKVLIIFVSLFILAMLWSCADEVTPPPSVTHPEDWATPSSAVFHGSKVKAVGYESCRTCHGSDYRGGSGAASCYNCHDETAGMEACNLCHGNREASALDLTTWAPPADLSGDTSTIMIGVGAHQVHLGGDTWSSAYNRNCGLCHAAMSGFDDPDHIDQQPGINVVFGKTASWNGKVSPYWDHNNAACGNTYCHGNFAFKKSESANQWGYEQGSDEILGNNQEMIWTDVGTGKANCGSCHSLPPMGHIEIRVDCNYCHGSVVDANYNIINKGKHINGYVDMN